MIQSDIQKLEVDDIVTMFILDSTNLRSNIDGSFGSILHFCSSTDNNTEVVWQELIYNPYPIKADGFERTSQGQMPRPKMIVSDISGLLGAMVNEFDDLLGATVTRIRTLKKYLDNGESPDPTIEFPREKYKIIQKSGANRDMLEFTLGSPFDLQGKKVPSRMVLKQACLHTYRRWDGSIFDYSKATCPYTGTNYYDKFGVSTISENDECGRRLSDCVLRFGNNTLPTWAFPGVYNVRR